ncbi:MAG: translocation/assembly module TamB domain-containing protein, partial [Burkholderiaceae bacterium]
RVGADVVLHSAQSVQADVVVQRSDGDVALKVGDTLRPAGLTELRLALSARDRVWRISETVAGTGLGELVGNQALQIAAGQRWPGPDTALSGGARLRANELGTWNPLLPAGWRIGGQLEMTASVGGTLGKPVIDGRLSGDRLAVRNLFEGVDVRDGTLAATLSGDAARIERLVFKDAAEGTLRVEGSATFGATAGARMTVTAEQFRILNRLDRRISASGQSSIVLASERLAVTGRYVLDEGLIDLAQADAPKLDSDVVVVNRRIDLARSAAQRAEAAARPPQSPFRNTDVQLTVDLGERLRLRGRGIDTLLKGALRITTPGGQLAVNGTVRTDSGTYAAYGQNLSIERGVIVFNGDVSTPRLDILAVRPDIDTRVGVTVQGSALNPRIRLYSDPELTEMDKLSWLVLGREPSGLGGGDTALLQRAALALAAGEGGGGSGEFLKKLGLDELSVSGLSSGDVSQAVVTVGKQISKNLFVGYERGLNTAAGSWQLIYRLARRFTLRAKSGDESAIDAIWTWRWN